MDRIYSKEEFSRILEQERARSDRTGREFSIVVFVIENQKNYKSLIYNLSEIIRQRIRCSDEIGWINPRRLGVMLADTPVEGAQKLAEDVCNGKTPKSIRIKYIILVYPSHWFNGYKDITPQSFETKSSNNSDTRKADSYSHTIKKLEPVLLKRIPLWKRVMDIFIALLGLLFISPLFLLISLFIKIVSPGPIFFKQVRIGYLGQYFTCWKFRTMRLNASISVHQQHISELINKGQPLRKLDVGDPRIIPLGYFMRKTGLDELPQLINVFRGEMSLIGPRPCIPYEARQFLTWQNRRFDTLPGLTGLWQVNGKNRTTFNEMMRLDISYTKKRSFWLDLKILIKTLPAIIKEATY